jgi:phospholipid/cholesterol/gamma-HCH transport system ATP-binding protein
MIRVENLCRSFDGAQVLKGVSFEVRRGELVALIGGSGGGKSVLLKHIAGLMTPDRGRVLIDEKDIHDLGGRHLSAFRDRLGFLFQGGALFDSMTVLENVSFPVMEKRRLPRDQVRQMALKELDHVGLSGAEDKYPSQISGGMVKRTALARALVMEPEIMFFDEPTTGLDPVIGRSILQLIRDCHRRLSFTGIIVSHMIPGVLYIVDRVLMLKDGAICFDGTSEEFLASEAPAIKAFTDTDVKDGRGASGASSAGARG